MFLLHCSTINRLLDPGPGGSRAVENWSFDSQELNDASAAPLTSSDTLDRNPGFVNPNDLTNGNNDHNMEEEEEVANRPGPSGVAGGKQMANVKVEQTANQVIYFTPPDGQGEHNYVTVVEQTPVTAYELQQQNVQIVAVAGAGPGGGGGGGVVSSPTCANPTHDTWRGQYDFEVKFLQYGQSTKNKSWDVSFKSCS